MFPSVVNQQIHHKLLTEKKIELFIKREDLLHPHISGNKFRKLKYNIKEAKKLKQHTLLTFGGAYSNHILATAAAGSYYGFKTIGIIRGEELGVNLTKTLSENKTLAFAVEKGMQLYFVSREEYRLKDELIFLEKLKDKFGDFYLLPEGGTNELAIKGCEEILTKNDVNFDVVCCAVGTGGTLSGIINSSAEAEQKIIGFSVLKEDFLSQNIENKSFKSNWELNRNYHFGGYAKVNDELITFINSFYTEQKIALDPIYTGKMLYGIFQEIKDVKFIEKTRILAIHTGGLQGVYGINRLRQKKQKSLIKINYEI